MQLHLVSRVFASLHRCCVIYRALFHEHPIQLDLFAVHRIPLSGSESESRSGRCHTLDTFPGAKSQLRRAAGQDLLKVVAAVKGCHSSAGGNLEAQAR